MNPIKIISASAGSGKTHRLAEELKDAVLSGEVRPEAVLATTFTVKSASELRQRVRSHLLAAGRRTDAQRLAAARFGTVNAVCGRLVNDFAFELGLSPELDVLDEGTADRALVTAMSSILTAEDERSAARLDHVLGGWDWQAAVGDIVKLARSNTIGPAAMAGFVQRSQESLFELLGPVAADGDVLDAPLLNSIEGFLNQHASSGDTTATTEKVLPTLRQAQRLLSGGRPLPWDQWAKLGSLGVAVKSRAAAAVVTAAATAHDRHPRLRSDVASAIQLAFDLSARMLDAYQNYKLARGVIDFVDQETYALRLLERDDVRQRLGAELDLVMVDEFQDTSPIQLAIFLRLAAIADRSVWVGDQKQAIYGFRGSDPALMDAAIDRILAGAEPEKLPKSWRSRPDLVRLTSDLFAPAFDTAGIPSGRVHLEPAHDREPEGLGEIVECWSLDSRSKPKDALALADVLSALLADDVTVRDPVSQSARPIRPGDVAVLCRMNDTCAAVARALEARGVRAVLPRFGLLATPEARVALSGQRLWVDAGDSMAASELAFRTEYAADPDAWLSRAVQTPGPDAFCDCPVVRAVLAARDADPGASPLTALDAVIDATRAVELCHRWGGTAPRLANLERLRAHVLSYVNSRLAEGGAVSTAGLIRWLASLSEGEQDKRGVSIGDDAVTVSTWHAAKGLEWPVTVLFELDGRSADRAALGVRVVNERPAFDLDGPLADRWIRFWPYPYGRVSKGIPMLDRLADHAATAEAREWSRREEMRLLYVGWTRARDRLVLAARQGKLSGGTLGLLRSDASEGVTDPAGDEVEWAGRTIHLKRRDGVPVDEAAPPALEPEPAMTEHEARAHAPAWRLPSALAQRGPTGEPIVLGERIAVHGAPGWDDLGNAVHGFLAADDSELSVQQRRVVAGRQLEAWSVTGAVTVHDMLTMADRLWTWLARRCPDARRRREWPVAMRADGSRWTGVADLVLELKDRLLLVDHKTFPGSPDQAAETAAGYWGQVDAYRRMLAAATGKPVVEAHVHFPVLGIVVPLDIGTVGSAFQD